MKSDCGQLIYDLIAELYPICRSITGDGVRRTLRIVGEHIPLDVVEVSSGTRVFDWTVPKEWNIRDAWIRDESGKRIVEFKKHNLHVLNYSLPVRRKIGLAELREHLFTLPDHPDWIPYRTSYYDEAWGFCMTHRQYAQLEDQTYEVMIDSTLEPGSLTYGELLIRGNSDEEILIATHLCHPSLCNDNLSGVALATHLARELVSRNSGYSYRFLFVPGTIGSITWLSLNQQAVGKIRHGLVISLLGDTGSFCYKKSRRGNAEIDRIVARVLQDRSCEHRILDFSPYGYDERQFCSPGFNLPVGRLTRTPNGEFPEYHTSADDLNFVSPNSLAGSFELLLAIVDEIETAERYLNLKPHCEPQLGTRGLYSSTGGEKDLKEFQLALLWVLNLSDGTHSLKDIETISGMPPATLRLAIDALLKTDLLERL